MLSGFEIAELVDCLRTLDDPLLHLQSVIRLRVPQFDSEGASVVDDADDDERTNFFHRRAMIVDDRCGCAVP